MRMGLVEASGRRNRAVDRNSRRFSAFEFFDLTGFGHCREYLLPFFYHRYPKGLIAGRCRLCWTQNSTVRIDLENSCGYRALLCRK
jgi:hypothetical protein